MLHPKSEALWARAERVLAGGPATLSKHPGRFAEGIAPKLLSHGQDYWVFDVDGNAYVDGIAALGPILLGHNHHAVTQAVRSQAKKLTSASLSTALEVEVAERLVELIPGAEQVRFGKHGKDVTEAAIKVARYVTGRQHVIFCGYAGGFDSYLSTTDKSGGILPQVAPFNHQVVWRDMQALEQVLEVCLTPRADLAAIMLEVPPEPWDVTTENTATTIRAYQEAARKHGALFILDEIVTGWRYALGGAQAYYGVQADVATFSKALGNGYALSALTGPRDVMQCFNGGQVFLSTTFGGECIGLAAAKAVLTTLQTTPALQHLQTHGEAVRCQVQQALVERQMPARLRGNFARMVLDWQDVPERASAAELRTLWLQETVKAGVLFSVPIFPMCAYDDYAVSRIVNAATAAFEVIQQVTDGMIDIHDALECAVIQDVFASRYEAQHPKIIY